DSIGVQTGPSGVTPKGLARCRNVRRCCQNDRRGAGTIGTVPKGSAWRRTVRHDADASGAAADRRSGGTAAFPLFGDQPHPAPTRSADETHDPAHLLVAKTPVCLDDHVLLSPPSVGSRQSLRQVATGNLA